MHHQPFRPVITAFFRIDQLCADLRRSPAGQDDCQGRLDALHHLEKLTDLARHGDIGREIRQQDLAGNVFRFQVFQTLCVRSELEYRRIGEIERALESRSHLLVRYLERTFSVYNAHFKTAGGRLDFEHLRRLVIPVIAGGLEAGPAKL